MTAQEHYREAERLLAEANKWAIAEPTRLDWLAEAQVHATLALAHLEGDITRAG